MITSLKFYMTLKTRYIAIFSLVSLFLLCGCEKSPEDKIVDFLQSDTSDTLILGNITDFEWDAVWIIPQTQYDFDPFDKLKEKNINLEDLKSKGFNVGQYTEYLTPILYISGKNIVHIGYSPIKKTTIIDWYPLVNFDFKGQKYIYLLKENAIFIKLNKTTLIPINMNSNDNLN